MEHGKRLIVKPIRKPSKIVRDIDYSHVFDEYLIEVEDCEIHNPPVAASANQRAVTVIRKSKHQT